MDHPSGRLRAEGDWEVCDTKARQALVTFFRGKIPAEAVNEAVCRCCGNYHPASYADHDCGPGERKDCDSATQTHFYPKKRGFELMIRATDVVGQLKGKTPERA